MNGIEKELAEEAHVVRVNFLHENGKQVAERFNVTSGSTTVVVNGAGIEVYRNTGFPSRKKIVEVVREASV